MFFNKVPLRWTSRWATDFENQCDVRIVSRESFLESSNCTERVLSFKHTAGITHHQKQKAVFRQIEVSPRKAMAMSKLHNGWNMKYWNRAVERYCVLEKLGSRPYFVYERKGLEPFVWNNWEFPEPVTDHVALEKYFLRQSRSGVENIIGIDSDYSYVVVRGGDFF